MNERAKAEFMQIWTERVQRDYADAMLEWLERETDFFEAPASTKNHGAHPGGLVEHSLNVYRRLRNIVCMETYGEITSGLLAEGVEETVAILGLLHDVTWAVELRGFMERLAREVDDTLVCGKCGGVFRREWGANCPYCRAKENAEKYVNALREAARE